MRSRSTRQGADSRNDESEMNGQTDPAESASAAGLHYVRDDQPGYQRRRAGRGFFYRKPDGKRLTDTREIERIKSLAIPPAWTDVWICTSPRGHLQATGRDARGRKQYRYHPLWREVRDTTKYERMAEFGEVLPVIRKRVEQDLGLPGLPKEKVLATVVRLLETTFIRVGNPEYAKENHSYGLTTMRDKHVEINGSRITFQFLGKSGKSHEVDIQDRRLATIVKRCRDIPGYQLFQYLDESGERQDVTSTDVNAYLRDISGHSFTAKDFRTWAGTVLAVSELREMPGFETEQEAEQQIVEVIKSVAEQLGNTPTVCRKCYVHPIVLERYVAGSLTAQGRTSRRGKSNGHQALDEPEVLVLDILKQQS